MSTETCLKDISRSDSLVVCLCEKCQQERGSMHGASVRYRHTGNRVHQIKASIKLYWTSTYDSHEKAMARAIYNAGFDKEQVR